MAMFAMRPQKDPDNPDEAIRWACQYDGTELESSAFADHARRAHGTDEFTVDSRIPAAPRPVGDYHDEDTLAHVAEALVGSGLTGDQASNAINECLNNGILFRERR